MATVAFTLLYFYLLRVRAILAAREDAREELDVQAGLTTLGTARG